LRRVQEARQKNDAFALAFHLRPLLLTAFTRWRDRPHDSFPLWAWRPPLTRNQMPAAAPQAVALTESELRRLVAELDRQIQTEPKAWEAWAARGWCRHLLGDADAALADLKQASVLQPDEPGLWALRGTVGLKHQRLNEAEAVRQRLASWPGVDAAVWHSVEANACQAEGALAEAHWHLTGLLDRQATPSVALLLRRGRLSLARGQENEAAADFARAVQHDEQGTDAWLWHARACLATGDADGYRRACAALLMKLKATVLVPGAARVQLFQLPLGLAQAVQDGGTDVVNMPAARHPVKTVVVRTVMLGPNAVADPAAAPELLPQNVQDAFTQTARGGLLLRAGKHTEAIAELQKAAAQRRAGEAPVAELVLALAYHQQGKAEAAKRALATARFVLERETPLRQAGLLFGGASGGPLTAVATAAVPSSPPRWDWPTQLEVRLFRREAEALIEAPPAKRDQ
jgi:tetratricopeptide (TPR) repeat protein